MASHTLDHRRRGRRIRESNLFHWSEIKVDLLTMAVACVVVTTLVMMHFWPVRGCGWCFHWWRLESSESVYTMMALLYRRKGRERSERATGHQRKKGKDRCVFKNPFTQPSRIHFGTQVECTETDLIFSLPSLPLIWVQGTRYISDTCSRRKTDESKCFPLLSAV